ncbi:MAG: sulfatase [Pirellulales bacterium]
MWKYLTALTLLLWLTAAAPAADRPNILFIMTDDHASHAISVYGSKVNETPNIDRLAREGMRFENCFVTNSICGPARAVILTGLYSHLNGFRQNGDRFDGSQQNVAKLLRQSGYHTAMIGKWHLGSDPTGFDYWNILPGQGAYYDPAMIEMGQRAKHEGYVTDIITDLTIDHLESRWDREKPFFVMCHHKAPHRNWQPGPDHQDLYADQEIPAPVTFNDDYSTRTTAAHTQEMTIEHHLRVPADTKVHPPEGLEGQALKKWKYQRYMEDYLRCVASVDDNVGRLLDYLEQEGLAENTMVIYTSDQGFYLGDHGWFDKRFMYEESLRTPLIVRYPGVVEPDSVDARMVLNLDVPETFLDIAGADIPETMQGRSLRPLLSGNPPEDWQTSIYYHYYEYPGAHSVRRHNGVRTERYKLIHFYRLDEWELFDLEKDPHELNNVYGNPEYAEIQQELKAELNRLEEKFDDQTATSEG